MRRAIGAVVLLLLASASARAMPSFARRYGFSCNTCHAGGPAKLRPFGEAFRDNGYRIPDDDAKYLREQPMALGDPARASFFPRALYPGEIPGWVPLGVGGIVSLASNLPSLGSSRAPATLSLDADALLMFAGSLGDHFTLVGELYGGTSGAGLLEAFGIVRGLFSRWLGEAGLNLKVGHMPLDLFVVQPNLGRSVTRALPLSARVGQDGFTIGGAADAIEVWGVVARRFKWVVGVANGAKPDDDTSTRRDLFGRLQIAFGKRDPDGLFANTGPLFNLGAFAYWGAGVVVPSASGMNPPPMRYTNDLLRIGADARLRLRGLDVIAQAIVGRDGDPDGNGHAEVSLAWSVEVDGELWQWLQPYARYEELRFAGPNALIEAPQHDAMLHPDRSRLVVGWAFFARANVRVRVEGVFGLAGDPSQLVVDLFMAM